jgi:uroporphyrin-III C-methyltransferase/precorrin-2 dehydrogenase/sirohydrochlorin ferrochelatase
MFARLEGRPVLLVGGGEVALRKARLLLAAGARITLVSPALEPEFHEFAGRFTHVAARFDPAHLAGQILVVAATDDLEVNALVYQSATERGLFVNLVDDPERSSFIFPSIIDRSPIVVAVSSGGKARAGALLRERLESCPAISAVWRSSPAGCAARPSRCWPPLRSPPLLGAPLPPTPWPV